MSVITQAPPTERVKEVHIRITDEGIDKKHHPGAVVMPGDRIRWSIDWQGPGDCKCKFLVSDFKRIADLDRLAHLGLPAAGGLNPRRAHAGSENTWEIGMEPALERWREPEYANELDQIFRKYEKPDLLEMEQWLFEDDWPETQAFREVVVSSPVARNDGHWLWSYTWTVIDGNGVIHEEDPHIFVHQDD